MRNIYIYLSLLLLLCAKGRGQGSDVIFLVDNSGSIGDNPNVTEYAELQESIGNLMTEVLECNPENKIAVVQYAQNNPRIFIETDFVNTSYTFTRRYFNSGGNIPGSVDLLADALHAEPNAGITSTQKTLTRTSGNALVVYIFTDATRDNDLVTGAGAGNPAFLSYTNFKNDFGATFIVTLITTDTAANNAIAVAAAASIASKGGGYTGAIEGYPNDPDGQFETPRYLLDKDNFRLSAPEIEIITDDICSVAMPDCVDYLTLISTTHDVTTHDNRQTKFLIDASNKINSSAVGIYHSEQTIVLSNGFHSDNGSRFRAYIDLCNSGYELRPGSDSNKRTAAQEEPSLKQDKLFVLAPNPASDKVKITAIDNIQSIVVTSMDGKTILNRSFKDGIDSYELNVRNYVKGFYVITVTTQKGEYHTEKLIKK